MTFYARILELHPEYEGMRAADLAAQGMACPAERSAELLGMTARSAKWKIKRRAAA